MNPRIDLPSLKWTLIPQAHGHVLVDVNSPRPPFGFMLDSDQAAELADGLYRATGKQTISRVMSELGRRGGMIGGKRRMESMTPEQRTENARRAAQARWRKK